ncbi:MAG: hypothetical protein OQK35_00365 [Alphaproteobacteria bacterium]|nr:hypothetical protein [Rhodospirillales bacterium]MCW9044763.1 hypothetical protein [Alphaproteobacteria bacterium]
MDIKKMLFDALQAQEQNAFEREARAKNINLEVFDEYKAEQLAWSIPLIAAAEELKVELKNFSNFKIESHEFSISMTVRPETNEVYVDDLEFTVSTPLPSAQNPEKIYLCETIIPNASEINVKAKRVSTVEEAMAWLIEKAAMGIKGNFQDF